MQACGRDLVLRAQGRYSWPLPSRGRTHPPMREDGKKHTQMSWRIGALEPAARFRERHGRRAHRMYGRTLVSAPMSGRWIRHRARRVESKHGNAGCSVLHDQTIAGIASPKITTAITVDSLEHKSQSCCRQPQKFLAASRYILHVKIYSSRREKFGILIPNRAAILWKPASRD